MRAGSSRSCFRLGLTGSIATGKSSVLTMFHSAGAAVFSADAAVHELYRGAAASVVERLFPGVVVDGAVDRAALSGQILGAPDRLAKLEAAVHPLVRGRLRQFFTDAAADAAPLAVADIPLLFETGFDYGLDAIAVTICPEAELRRRALARPGMTVEKLDAILSRQLPQEEKARRGDFVIDTGGSREDTETAVRAIVRSIQHGQAMPTPRPEP